MSVFVLSPVAGVLFVIACLTNAACALWLLNTRYRKAALTYRIGMMALTAGTAMAGLGVVILPARPLFPSDMIIQLGLALMFGLLARDQTRLGGAGERRRNVS